MFDRSRGSARFNSPTFCAVCGNGWHEERNNWDAFAKFGYFLSTDKLGFALARLRLRQLQGIAQGRQLPVGQRLPRVRHQDLHRRHARPDDLPGDRQQQLHPVHAAGRAQRRQRHPHLLGVRERPVAPQQPVVVQRRLPLRPEPVEGPGGRAGAEGLAVEPAPRPQLGHHGATGSGSPTPAMPATSWASTARWSTRARRAAARRPTRGPTRGPGINTTCVGAQLPEDRRRPAAGVRLVRDASAAQATRTTGARRSIPGVTTKVSGDTTAPSADEVTAGLARELGKARDGSRRLRLSQVPRHVRQLHRHDHGHGHRPDGPHLQRRDASRTRPTRRRWYHAVTAAAELPLPPL